MPRVVYRCVRYEVGVGQTLEVRFAKYEGREGEGGRGGVREREGEGERE